MQPKNCFVALFDIIGFKALRHEKGTAGLYQLYQRGIQPMIEHSAAGKGKTITRNGQSCYVPDFSESSLKFKILSDSVVFYTLDDTFNSFLAIVDAAHQLLQSGFAGSKAPFRGAIGYGDLIDDDRGTYIGSAIEDAYIGESSQIWAGCILTDACENFALFNDFIKSYKKKYIDLASSLEDTRLKENCLLKSVRIVEYDSPMQHNPKNGPIKYYSNRNYVLDWTTKMFDNAAEKSFKDSENEHAKKIQENTITFEKWAKKNNRNFTS